MARTSENISNLLLRQGEIEAARASLLPELFGGISRTIGGIQERQRGREEEDAYKKRQDKVNTIFQIGKFGDPLLAENAWNQDPELVAEYGILKHAGDRADTRFFQFGNKVLYTNKKNPSNEDWNTMEIPGTEELINVPAGTTVLDPLTRQPIFTAPYIEKPPTPIDPDILALKEATMALLQEAESRKQREEVRDVRKELSDILIPYEGLEGEAELPEQTETRLSDALDFAKQENIRLPDSALKDAQRLVQQLRPGFISGAYTSITGKVLAPSEQYVSALKLVIAIEEHQKKKFGKAPISKPAARPGVIQPELQVPQPTTQKDQIKRNLAEKLIREGKVTEERLRKKFDIIP